MPPIPTTYLVTTAFEFAGFYGLLMHYCVHSARTRLAKVRVG